MPDKLIPAIDCLKGSGEMGERMRQTDWAQTALGSVAGWSQALRTTVGLVLRNGFPLCAWWGPELVQFYNDPFRPTLGAKHPAACGQSGRVCWAEIWQRFADHVESAPRLDVAAMIEAGVETFASFERWFERATREVGR